jgi:hypothetical protein
MNATVTASDDFQRMLWSGLSSGAIPEPFVHEKYE